MGRIFHNSPVVPSAQGNLAHPCSPLHPKERKKPSISPGLVLTEKMTVSGRSEHTELGQETGTPCACESFAFGVGDSVTTAASVLVSSSAGGAQRMLGCLSALLAVHQPRRRHGHTSAGCASQGQDMLGGYFPPGCYLRRQPMWALKHPAVVVGGRGIIVFPTA